MTGRKNTGRMKRTAAWFLVIGTLCTLLPASALAESSSTTASVDFTPEPTIKPVAPTNPDWPVWEEPSSPDQTEAETLLGNRRESVLDSNSETGSQTSGATGAAGWLTINYVTPLNYGTEIANGVFTVQQERPYLQTSDLRGTATGWKVTAIAGPFQDPGDETSVQALLSFCDGSPNSAHTYMVPPKIPDKIELPANGRTQRLVEFAHENEGVGIWVVRWYPQHGAAHDFQLRLFSPVSNGRLGFVLWVMNDAP